MLCAKCCVMTALNEFNYSSVKTVIRMNYINVHHSRSFFFSLFSFFFSENTAILSQDIVYQDIAYSESSLFCLYIRALN